MTSGIPKKSEAVLANQASAIDRGTIELIEFRGHPNIRGNHRNTIEITKDSEISTRADCIIGVRATKACLDLNNDMKRHIQASGFLEFELGVGELVFSFKGKGLGELDLTDSHELVLRRSDFASSRTMAISCDCAAVDIPREMIMMLKDSSRVGFLRVRATNGSENGQDLPMHLLEP